MPLDIGQKAPLFSLTDQKGETFRLENYIGTRNIILYFYPMDETPGCIKEACEFRDQITEFENYNCEVVGISSDSVKSHSTFAVRHKLPFILLSDKTGRVRKLYDVKPAIFGLLPGRKTFIINITGTITHIFDFQFKAKKHIKEALIALSHE